MEPVVTAHTQELWPRKALGATGLMVPPLRIGVVLRERGGLPPGFVLSTKVDPDPQTRDYSGAQARRSVERSLTLLGLDHLQVVYLHDPENTTFEQAMAPDGPVAALQQCRAEGVIAQIGVAGGPIDLMMRYVET